MCESKKERVVGQPGAAHQHHQMLAMLLSRQVVAVVAPARPAVGKTKKQLGWQPLALQRQQRTNDRVQFGGEAGLT